MSLMEVFHIGHIASLHCMTLFYRRIRKLCFLASADIMREKYRKPLYPPRPVAGFGVILVN